MDVHVCTSSCVYVHCMCTCYYSLLNCSVDEDVFGDASHGKASVKHRLSTGVQEKRENFTCMMV